MDLQADGLARSDQFRPELLGLPAGAVGQLAARNPVGESQVILDARALTGLATGGGAFDEHRPQALGRPVHRGRQPRRPATDHDEVVEILRRRGGQAERRGEVAVGRVDQGLALLGDEDRECQAVLPGGLQQPLAFGFIGAEPGVVEPITGQELANLR